MELLSLSCSSYVSVLSLSNGGQIAGIYQRQANVNKRVVRSVKRPRGTSNGSVTSDTRPCVSVTLRTVVQDTQVQQLVDVVFSLRVHWSADRLLFSM